MADYRDEKKLVAGLRAGEREAYERLLDLYQDKVYGMARRMVGGLDAEDAAQDALVEICNSVKGFKGRSSLATWVYRVAMNVCLERRRMRRLETVPIEENTLDRQENSSSEPGAVAVRNETKTTVNNAIDSLPDIHRDVVILHELHGLTYSECAEALSCPVGTVKSRLSNAFRALREQLREYASEGGLEL
ncbi:MAG: sigma-70 family RNA polymerase sigma factor [Armatimonadetes bacterium]|nr:sigma-70 family RNA polymerase sigma factor [Armatimonadota bacterium]